MADPCRVGRSVLRYRLRIRRTRSMTSEPDDEEIAEEATEPRLVDPSVWFTDDGSDDDDSSFKDYDITASPNDFNIRTIVDFIDAGPVKIPGFQRNYVWDIKR